MTKLSKITETLSIKFYPPMSYKDDNVIFYEWIKSYLKPDHIILDCGAGTGLLNPYNFKGHCKKVVGIDLDERVLKNPLLDEAYVENFMYPYFPEQSFNIVFANNVVEHIKKPAEFLKEMKRILRPEGVLFIKTSNRWHYVGVIGSFTPHWFHRFYNKLRGVREEDVFPTFYKINQIIQIKNLGKKLNFNYEIKFFEGRPEYLTLNPIMFFLGVIYERIVNLFPFCKIFRSVILLKITFL